MDYISKSKREINLFDIETQTKTLILELNKKSGLFYFVKMFDENLFYVLNNRTIMMYSMQDKTHTKLAKSSSDILNIFVYSSKLRNVDWKYSGMLPPINSDEENKLEMQVEFKVVAFEESGKLITVQKKEGEDVTSSSFKIKEIEKFPKDLMKKDLFGMGYPYIISGYGKMISVATDYGLLVFENE